MLRSENPETAAAAAADVIRLAWLQRSSEQLLRADRGARNLLRLLPADCSGKGEQLEKDVPPRSVSLLMCFHFACCQIFVLLKTMKQTYYFLFFQRKKY